MSKAYSSMQEGLLGCVPEPVGNCLPFAGGIYAQRELFGAIREAAVNFRGDLKAVEAAVEKLDSMPGVNINDNQTPEGSTPLNLAIESGRTDLVRLLLEKDADPTLPDFYKRTPLMKVSKARKSVLEIFDMIKTSISEKADLKEELDKPDVENYTAVVHAAVNLRIDLMVKLILSGGDPLVKCGKNKDSSLLIEALKEDSNQPDAVGLTVSMINKLGKHQKQMLTEAGGDGMTPLMHVGYAYPVEVREPALKALLTQLGPKDAKEHMDSAKDENGLDAYLHLVRAGVVSKAVFGSVESVERQDEHGRGPLFYAAFNSAEVINEILDIVPTPNAKDVSLSYIMLAKSQYMKSVKGGQRMIFDYVQMGAFDYVWGKPKLGADPKKIEKEMEIAVIALSENGLPVRSRQLLDKFVVSRITEDAGEETITFSLNPSNHQLEDPRDFTQRLIKVLGCGDPAVVMHPALRGVATRLWKDKLLFGVMAEFIAFLVYLLLFTIGSFMYAESNQTSTAYVMVGASLVIIVVFQLIEVLEMFRFGVIGYLLDVWNWIDLITYAMAYLSFFCRITNWYGWHEMTSWAIFLSWMRLFQYLTKFDTFGVLVLIIGQMISNTVLFLVVLTTFLISFGIAFHVLLKDVTAGVTDQYATLYMSFMTMFRGMVGDQDYDTIHETHYLFGTVLYILFILLVFVLLLNLLVALLSDQYEDVRQQSQEVMQVLKCEAIEKELVRMGPKKAEKTLKSVFGNNMEKLIEYKDSSPSNNVSEELSACITADTTMSRIGAVRDAAEPDKVTEESAYPDDMILETRKYMTEKNDVIAVMREVNQNVEVIVDLFKQYDKAQRIQQKKLAAEAKEKAEKAAEAAKEAANKAGDAAKDVANKAGDAAKDMAKNMGNMMNKMTKKK